MPTKKTNKKPRKELLTEKELEKSLVIDANFALLQVLLKEDKRWRMKIGVYKILPKSYHDYTIHLIVDEEPFEKRIQSVEEKIERIRKERSLFAEKDDKEIRDQKELIVDIQNELAEMKDKCEEMEFVAEIEEIKYKDGNTVVLMKVPDNVIEPLNKSKMFIQFYKIEFSPLL